MKATTPHAAILLTECATVLRDGTGKENGGMGRGGLHRAGMRDLCPAYVPSGRTHRGGQNGGGLPDEDCGQAGSPTRSPRQGGGAEFLGELVSALHSRDTGPEPFTGIHRIAGCAGSRCESG